ncbi:MAG: NUDIX domain-containing protein [Nocardioides sp.]
MPPPPHGGAPPPSLLHLDAVATLRAWDPPTPEQAALRDRYVAHLSAHPDGLTRGCFPDHLTAGTLVLSATGDAVLLNLHAKAGRWFAFGGHCEADDTTLAGAARREAREESGLDDLEVDPVPLHLDEHTVGFCDPRGEVHHLDVRFGAVAAAGAAHAVSAESLDVRWWPLSGLPELEEEMHQLIGAARHRFFGPSGA